MEICYILELKIERFLVWFVLNPIKTCQIWTMNDVCILKVMSHFTLHLPLGFVLLHTTMMMINWWKKWIDFVKIKFYSNNNIEWRATWIELNWIEFKFN
jgi:hypothetical protein